MTTMILVTGGTGFIGQALIRHLVESGQRVRILLRPASRSPNLPKGVSVDVTVSSLKDERGLRAAMVDVDTIYHLAGIERSGAYGSLMEVDIRGTQAVVNAAIDAKINRLFFLSHLGADRGSAYPVFKAKAIAEEFVRRSGIDYTIIRSAIIFGAHDGFTTGLAQLLYALPSIFLVPGDGKMFIQPLWVEDLVTCLTWALDDDRTRNQLYELGGPETFTFNQVLGIVMDTVGVQRRLVHVHAPYLRGLTIFLEDLLPSLPISVYWLDYLATNRTCALDTVPRYFNLMPSRFSQRLAYLHGEDWSKLFWRSILRRQMSHRKVKK